jgi:predicted TIM-barrel fold metal-dependent hydrolase
MGKGSVPSCHFKDPGLSKALAVSTNDFIARILKEDLDRFRGIASVALKNLDDAFEELGRALCAHGAKAFNQEVVWEKLLTLSLG